MAKKSDKKSDKDTKSRNRQYDKDVAEALAQRGHSKSVIADKCSISKHTASKLITKVNAIRGFLNDYRTKRNDIYTYLHSESVISLAEGLKATREMLEAHNKGDKRLNANQVAVLLDKSAMAFDRIFYQERLHEGKSTENKLAIWDKITQNGDSSRRALYQSDVIEVDQDKTT
tara:strand:+ start:353 stop:871 length:519 start_codon:yes stop_codon:yes gene_type:complete